MAVREEVQDQYGNTIYLTDERWEHILENHPELDGYRAEVIRTVRSGKRTQDAMIPYKFYYSKRFPRLSEEFDAIEAVVLFKWQNDQPNNFIITAYST